MDQCTVSVVIPVLNEAKRLRACLANDYPSRLVNIIVVDGGSADGSQAIARSCGPRVRVLESGRGIARQLNVGILASDADIIVRADAHSEYASSYIRECVKALEESGAAVVGGAQRAVGDTWVASAIALATTSRFGVGDARFRTAKTRQWVDTVYLGAWRRETLLAVGRYDESSAFDEDYELNVRIRKAGGRILLVPEIVSRYFVRDGFRPLARQYFRYGTWKVLTLRLHPEALRLRHLAPPGLLFGLLVSALITVSAPRVGLVLPASYVAAVVLAALAVAARGGWRYLFALLFAFPVLHLSYGAGFLAGVMRFGPPHMRSTLLAGR
jgi:glycosyltransferase involved in cell wall biosynthesis